MAKCLLCTKKIGNGEQSFGTFGISPTGSLCESCFIDVKALYDHVDDNSFNVESEKFLKKYDNSSVAKRYVDEFLSIGAKEAPQATAKPQMQHTSSSNDASFSGIFSNPGKTLLSMAKAFFWICSIIGLFVGIFLGNTTDIFGYQDFNFVLFIIPLVIGIVVGYFGGLGLAAFGDLVVNVKDIKSTLYENK